MTEGHFYEKYLNNFFGDLAGALCYKIYLKTGKHELFWQIQLFNSGETTVSHHSPAGSVKPVYRSQIISKFFPDI